MKCNSSIHGNMKWISDILISSHSVWHGYSTLHPGFPCLFIMLILLMLSLSPRVYPGWLLASVRSLELIAEKAKPWLQQLLRVQIFFLWVLASYTWNRVTLCLPWLRDQGWFLFIFMEQIFSGCFIRTFSDCVYAIAA